jgi:SAM-dependent MidA family methyltransferase
MSDRTPLAEFIISEIELSGPVSFAWFMEQALYHPKHGYYSSGKARLGRSGDYFTSVSVGPTFGTLLAAQIAEIWGKAGKPDDFTIVEQGAHSGDLARDLLAALERNSRQCFDRLRYLIAEPFPALGQRQSETLANFAGKVIWCHSLETMEPFVGVHLSNELLDAFPVHLVCTRPRSPKNQENQWFEQYVDWHDGKFILVERPIADSALQRQIQQFPAPPDEFEFNQAALDWLDILSTKLQRGYVLMIDYGYVHDDLVVNRGGTLQCREQHHFVSSPFERIGERDITAHVNWSLVGQRAQEQKFGIAGFTDQHHFLTGIISEHPELANASDPSARRQLQTLLHPEMLGRNYQVLALSRGMDSPQTLSGFKFARPAHLQLGIPNP